MILRYEPGLFDDDVLEDILDLLSKHRNLAAYCLVMNFLDESVSFLGWLAVMRSVIWQPSSAYENGNSGERIFERVTKRMFSSNRSFKDGTYPLEEVFKVLTPNEINTLLNRVKMIERPWALTVKCCIIAHKIKNELKA